MIKHLLTIGTVLMLAIPGLTSGAGTVGKSSSSSSDAGQVSAELQQAIDAVFPALVRIEVVFEQGEDGRMRKMQAAGSGTIISKDGYILTNHHVAGRATRIVCRLSNREEVDATLVGTDPLSDLAIIKLDLSSRRNPKAPLAVAKFGDSDKLKVGDVVLAMGSPSGLSQSVTKGVVANTAMIMPFSHDFLLDGENVGELIRWIGHDAVIYHGNSGGPLVNLKGEIVGVNEMGIATMGGAIPSNLARQIAQELIQHGSVARSWIGVEVQPLLKSMTDAKGILVASVFTNSPGYDAGIKPGDCITEVNGKAVADSRSPEDVPLFNQLVLSAPVDSHVTLKGLRDGKPQTWKLTTVRRERNLAGEQELAQWGLTVRNFTRTMVDEYRRPDKKGVLIDSIRPGGPAEDAKPSLRRDDVITRLNGQEITNIAAMVQFTKTFTKGITEPKPVLVTCERDSQELDTVVKVGPEIEILPPGQTARAWMGVSTQPLTSDLAEALDLPGKKGVRVTQVSPDSPAKKAGIRTGDIFLKLDGDVIPASTLSDQELFENLIREYKIGSEVELAGVRDGKPLKLTVTLTNQPMPAANLAETKDDLFQFKARDLSYDDRVEERLPADARGVRIVSVERAGWAALAGLNSGDILFSIDGKTVDSIATLKSILARLRETKPRRVELFVQRGVHSRYLEIEPRW
jgi:serine protease Do